MQTSFLPAVLMILVIVLVLLSIVAIFYLYITAKNRERMALIEKGMNPNLARGDFWSQVGIIAGGIGLGLISDDLLHLGYGPLWAMLIAGTALVVYNVIRRSKLSQRIGL